MALFVVGTDESSGATHRNPFLRAGYIAPEKDWYEFFAPAWQERVLDGPPSIPYLLPVFARQVFRGGADTYSRLMAFSGAGSIAGALVVAWLGKFKRMGVTALTMQDIYGLLILAFSMSHTIWLSEVLLLFTGASLMMVFSTVTSLVQLIAPNAMRGRVMSIYMVAFRGGMPLGSLAGGYFATIIGAPKVIGINGSLLVLVALYFLLVRSHGIRESG